MQLELLDGSRTALRPDSDIRLTIRESTRARQLILQVLPPRTIEVVVPKGMRPNVIQAFIDEHRAWIDRAGHDLARDYPGSDLEPTEIELAAVGERVNVRYLEPIRGAARSRYRPGELSLHSARSSGEAGRLLRRWLLRRGSAVLKPWIALEAARTGLEPARVQVRLQKTRWGSCSSGGGISLNAALLLVPPELVRYLFVHELCHLRHMSHSRRFWRLVARHEPDCRALDRRLGRCWRQLPAWLFENA